jgi:HSP20 family protein
MMTMYISPYRRLASLRQAMDRLFEENFSDTQTQEREMLLAVDVKASDSAYEITALAPGLKAEDIDLEILNNTVTIRGEFKGAETKEEFKYLTCELPTGRFVRVVTLPTAVDTSKVEANIKNGVLALHLPKVEAHLPKSIKVKTA